MFTFVLLGVLTADSEPAPIALPVQSLVLHRNGVAWVDRAGAVSLVGGKAMVAIDPSALPGTWNAETPNGKPELRGATTTGFGSLAAASWSSWSRRHAGELLQLSVDRRDVVGRIVPFPDATDGTPTIAIEAAGELELIDPATIRQVRRPGPPMAVLEFAPELRTADVRTTALVAGFGWKPEFRLARGPDSALRLQLFAVIASPADETIDTKAAFCAIGFPKVPAAGVAPLIQSDSDAAAADPALFELGAVSLPAHHERRVRLVDCKTSSAIAYEWIAGAGEAAPKSSETVERVEALLRVPNTCGRSLPPGPALVMQGDGPPTAADMPYSPAGAVATLRLGTAAGIECRREEIEIERRQPKIRVENELYDYVKMAGTLSIVNRRPEAVALEIQKTFEGDGIAASDGGAVRRVPNQAGRPIPLSEVRWKLQVGPGETKRVTYGYMLYLAAGPAGN